MASSSDRLGGLMSEPRRGDSVVSPGRKTGVRVPQTVLRPRSGLVKHVGWIVFHPGPFQNCRVFLLERSRRVMFRLIFNVSLHCGKGGRAHTHAEVPVLPPKYAIVLPNAQRRVAFELAYNLRHRPRRRNGQQQVNVIRGASHSEQLDFRRACDLTHRRPNLVGLGYKR